VGELGGGPRKRRGGGIDVNNRPSEKKKIEGGKGPTLGIKNLGGGGNTFLKTLGDKRPFKNPIHKRVFFDRNWSTTLREEGEKAGEIQIKSRMERGEK